MTTYKIPAIGEYERHVGKLLKIEELPPEKPPKDYIFEVISARCDLFYKDNLIKNLFENSDFYGLGTSVKFAIEDAKEYIETMEITKDSGLDVVVVKVVEQWRKRPVNRENFYAKDYYDFEAPQWGSKRDLPDPVETIVWSFQKDGEDNAKI